MRGVRSCRDAQTIKGPVSNCSSLFHMKTSPPAEAPYRSDESNKGRDKRPTFLRGPPLRAVAERSPDVSSAPVKRRKSNKERYIKVKRSWAAGQKNRKRREKIVRNIPSQQIQAVRRPVLSHIRRAESTSAKDGPERRKELIAGSRCG